MRHKNRQVSRRARRAVSAAVVIACLGAAGTASAQQLLVFDETYTATAAGSFHHTVKPPASLPPNWVSPVDYSKGTAYIHHTVMDKPSKRTTTMTICFDGDLEGYGCITSKAYTEVGVYETVVPITKMWQYNKVAWNKKRTEFHLVVKDPALNGTPGGKPASDFVPSKMRLVVSMVPPGGTYVRPAGLPAPDAAPAAGDAGAAADVAPGAMSDAAAGPGAIDTAKPEPGPGSETPSPAAPPPAGSADAAAPSPASPTMNPPASTPPPAASPPEKPSSSKPSDPAPGGSAVGGACSMNPPGGASGGLPLLLLAGLTALAAARARRARR